VTNNRQEPFVYGSLGGDDVPLVPVKAVPVTAAPAPNPQVETRRDYELALQIGNKAALNAFLAQHPDGFYASLARLQLDKIAAEEARVAATEKARLAEQERARLAAEGAQKGQQAKAEADAKAAEQARIAAENAKRVAEGQAAEAERKRAPTDSAATDRTAVGPSTVQGDKGMNLASLSAGLPPAELVKSVQAELRRVGCLNAAADGEWNTASQRSLALFNKNAGTKFDVKLASTDALDAIKLKPSRVCPLICEHGFRADGDRCSKIVCAEGSTLNDDNECEKRRAKTPTAKRDDGDRPNRADRSDRAYRERPPSSPGLPGAGRLPQPSGQIVCGDGGCQPVARGCHLEYRTTAQGGPYEGGGGNVSICR
jgi:hypothetical protein